MTQDYLTDYTLGDIIFGGDDEQGTTPPNMNMTVELKDYITSRLSSYVVKKELPDNVQEIVEPIIDDKISVALDISLIDANSGKNAVGEIVLNGNETV